MSRYKFKDPSAPRWGVRKMVYWRHNKYREEPEEYYRYNTCWCAENPTVSDSLFAQGLTKERAEVIAKVLNKGQLGT